MKILGTVLQPIRTERGPDWLKLMSTVAFVESYWACTNLYMPSLTYHPIELLLLCYCYDKYVRKFAKNDLHAKQRQNNLIIRLESHFCPDLVSTSSPIVLWITVLKPLVRHYCSFHIVFLESELTIYTCDTDWIEALSPVD